ncbi:MFS transporter [Faecalicatena sp. AGMB00832]|uniref:MFS transporter n=1 Tax=Faecalicatena faecalis TaxID=2726362 RepID=A0ABS6D7V5_9FIRM|nr:MFS transporter [Faecalicatena faecalis]MBU3877606.1 MFS transporter [Faecalicatena faecalis]
MRKMVVMMLAEQQDKEKKESIWNRVYTCVFLANAMLFLGMQMVNTLISLYAEYLGAAATLIGIVSSLFALTALIFKVISGPAIDAFNRKYILMGAIAVIAVSFFGFAISITMPMVIGFRLLQGVGQAFTATCCLALAADSLPPERFGVGIGTFTLAQAACQAIGPSIGLELSKILGYQITFAIAGVCTMCGVFVIMLIKTPYREKQKFQISIKNIFSKEAMLPAILLLFLQMAFININSFLVIFANQRDVAGIGLFYTVYAVSMLFAPRTVGKLADHYGAAKVLPPAMLMFAFAFWLISESSALWMFLIAAVVAAFGYGASQPAVQTLCMKCVPKERRGSASSTSYIGQDLGNLIGPVLAGSIAEQVGYVMMWRAMMLPIIAAFVCVIWFRGRINKIETAFIESNKKAADGK